MDKYEITEIGTLKGAKVVLCGIAWTDLTKNMIKIYTSHSYITKICKQRKISSQNNVKFWNSSQVINNEKKMFVEKLPILKYLALTKTIF